MKASILLNASVAEIAAFFNTNAGSKLYICPTPQQADLTLGQYQGLAWTQVKGVGSHGETGSNTNILTYDTWDTDVVQKGKGMTNAGDPEVELARIPTDAGQIILRQAGLTNFYYAFKVERADKPTPNGTPTILYNRGLVSGPRRPNGRNEDFDLETYTLGLVQREMVVDPTTGGNAPVETAAPVITTDGTPQVGEVITVNNGTFTGDAPITYSYQWKAGGVPIAGANANTLLLTSAQQGKVITCIVTATNGSGSASAESAPTAVVA